MTDPNITLPSQPRIISEDNFRGSYNIDGLFPGYGHTLGNSLRRIILSSMTGAAITSVKINGADHEFSTLPGVKEDAIAIILALKKIRFQLEGNEPQRIQLSAHGVGEVRASDIKTGSQVEIVNQDLLIATLTDKKAALDIEITIEKGLGYVSKEFLRKDRVEVGTIFLDAVFTPICQVSYEVENMRVGDQTNYNRLRLNIETDGTISPREALEKSIRIMIAQLQAVVGFEEPAGAEKNETGDEDGEATAVANQANPDLLKTRIEDVNFSSRALKALTGAGIRTLGGLARKKESDLEKIEGLGGKGLQEIKDLLASNSLGLKS